MNIDKWLENIESEIEAYLLRSLYPNLVPSSRDDLRSQYLIDYYNMNECSLL